MVSAKEVRRTKYLSFLEEWYDHEGKTRRFLLMSRRGEAQMLGRIRWYPPWRQYAFYPEPDTMFEDECLLAIRDFLLELEAERRARRA